jgi:uncharacterized Zn-binding protein involved in type VI secretion
MAEPLPVARGFTKDKVVTQHLCTHESTTSGGSTRVFANGIGVARLGDLSSPHTILVGPACVVHSPVLNKSARTVFADGVGLARKTDTYNSTEVISTGSPTVFCGEGTLSIPNVGTDPLIFANTVVPTTRLIRTQDTPVFIPVIAAGGTGARVLSIEPPLPAGLTFDAVTGAITGIPTETIN